MERTGSLGSLLLEFLHQRQMSQNRLGRLAGIDHSMVSRLVHGSREPSKETLSSVSKALKLNFLEEHDLYASAGYLHPIAHQSFLRGSQVNVNDVFPTLLPEEFPEGPNPEAMKLLLDLRRETYQGFARLEETKGFLLPEVSLSTSKGQEIIRILLMRGIEEVLEFTEAIAREHQLEELIDAYNYFLSILILDPSLSPGYVLTSLSEAFEKASFGQPRESYQLTGDLLRVMSPFLAKLRNRPWQHQAQSLYFDGYPELVELLSVTTTSLASYFDSWEEFYAYFLAKDTVLRFRLRTRY